MASTCSTLKDSKQCSTSTSLDDTPTLATLMLAINHLKSDLQTDLQEVKLAISTTNKDLDTKVASISTTLSTLHNHLFIYLTIHLSER